MSKVDKKEIDSSIDLTFSSYDDSYIFDNVLGDEKYNRIMDLLEKADARRKEQDVKIRKIKNDQKILFTTFALVYCVVGICIFLIHDITYRHTNILEKMVNAEVRID